MKKIYHRLAALGLAAAALSSCGRATYTFNPSAPSYLGTAHPVAPLHEPVIAATTVPQPVAQPAVAATVPPLPARPARRSVPAQPAVISYGATTAIAAPAPKLNLGQRLALKKVMKRLAKAETRPQNTAAVAQTAARGTSFTLGIVGLAALIVGLIVSSGFLVVAGSIVLAVGIVLFILSSL